MTLNLGESMVMAFTPGDSYPPPPSGDEPASGWVAGTTIYAGGTTIYAGFWPRLAAYVVDLIIMGFISAPFRIALVQSRSDRSALAATVGIVLVTHAVYLIGFWSRRGQTIGMKLMKLRLERADDGGRVDLRMAAVRFIPFGVALFIAFIAVAVWIIMAVSVAGDKRHQGIQDRIAGTVVIRE